MSAAIADEELRARLLKVLRLARQGIGGEKENAESLLAKMLRRHGLTPADLHELEGEPSDLHWLKIADDGFDAAVVKGIVQCLFGREREMWANAGSRKKIGIDVTRAEQVSLDIAWEVYHDAWEDAKRDVLLAFLIRHELFDPKREPKPGDLEELTPDEKARQRRAAAIIDHLEHVDRPGRRVGGAR